MGQTEVDPVRDALGNVIPGLNGEPFIIANRKVIALFGILQ